MTITNNTCAHCRHWTAREGTAFGKCGDPKQAKPAYPQLTSYMATCGHFERREG